MTKSYENNSGFRSEMHAFTINEGADSRHGIARHLVPNRSGLRCEINRRRRMRVELKKWDHSLVKVRCQDVGPTSPKAGSGWICNDEIDLPACIHTKDIQSIHACMHACMHAFIRAYRHTDIHAFKHKRAIT